MRRVTRSTYLRAGRASLPASRGRAARTWHDALSAAAFPSVGHGLFLWLFSVPVGMEPDPPGARNDLFVAWRGGFHAGRETEMRSKEKTMGKPAHSMKCGSPLATLRVACPQSLRDSVAGGRCGRADSSVFGGRERRPAYAKGYGEARENGLRVSAIFPFSLCSPIRFDPLPILLCRELCRELCRR